MDRDQFTALIHLRWTEAQRRTGHSMQDLPWSFGDYPHFHTARGYGVTFFDKGRCWMKYPDKILSAPPGRADGVIRHELGHVVDMLVPKKELNRWAKARGVTLASTDERRADDIARCIWGTPIYYDDKLLVQTTQSRGATSPRPRHLGL